MEGRRGPKGLTCASALRGADGPVGRAMNPNVGLEKAPGDTDLIWAAEDDCLCFIDPAVATFLDIPN
jgi:hypothetical protein